MSESPKLFLGRIFSIVGACCALAGAAVLIARLLTVTGILLLLVGLCTAGIGLYFLRAEKKRIEAEKKLKESGRVIRAVVSGITMNSNISYNRVHPWIITAQYRDPDTNELHEFRFDEVFQKPQGLEPGQTMEILVDGKDYSTYSLKN